MRQSGHHIRALIEDLEQPEVQSSNANAYNQLFEGFDAEMEICLHPCFSTQIDKGINIFLSKALLKYWPELGGMLLSYSHGRLDGDDQGRQLCVSPYLHCKILFQGLGFRMTNSGIGLLDELRKLRVWNLVKREWLPQIAKLHSWAKISRLEAMVEIENSERKATITEQARDRIEITKPLGLAARTEKFEEFVEQGMAG